MIPFGDLTGKIYSGFSFLANSKNGNIYATNFRILYSGATGSLISASSSGDSI